MLRSRSRTPGPARKRAGEEIEKKLIEVFLGGEALLGGRPLEFQVTKELENFFVFKPTEEIEYWDNETALAMLLAVGFNTMDELELVMSFAKEWDQRVFPASKQFLKHAERIANAKKAAEENPARSAKGKEKVKEQDRAQGKKVDHESSNCNMCCVWTFAIVFVAIFIVIAQIDDANHRHPSASNLIPSFFASLGVFGGLLAFLWPAFYIIAFIKLLCNCGRLDFITICVALIALTFLPVLGPILVLLKI